MTKNYFMLASFLCLSLTTVAMDETATSSFEKEYNAARVIQREIRNYNFHTNKQKVYEDMYRRGLLYRDGKVEGFEKDSFLSNAYAGAHFLPLAYAGDVKAQHNLAMVYYQFDKYGMAYKWFNIASNKNFEPSINNREKLKKKINIFNALNIDDKIIEYIFNFLYNPKFPNSLNNHRLISKKIYSLIDGMRISIKTYKIPPPINGHHVNMPWLRQFYGGLATLQKLDLVFPTYSIETLLALPSPLALRSLVLRNTFEWFSSSYLSPENFSFFEKAGIKGMTARFQALAMVLDKFVNLEKLNLSSHDFGEEGIKIIAPVIGKMTKLQRLSLRWQGLESSGLLALSLGLAKLANLRKLDLYGNQIEKNGFNIIAATFPELLYLEILNLGDNEIGDDGAQLLAMKLPNLKKLLKLNIRGNHISSIGMQTLAPKLGLLTQLQELWVNANPLEDVGVQALAPELGNLVRLQVLCMSGNRIGDAGAQALAPQLAKLTNLQTLELHSNNFSDIGRQALGFL